MSQSSDFQRYDKSELWTFHNYYFKHIGLKAWDSGALPFTGVTSYNEALKKALLLVENLYLAGFNENGESIRILEVGAGSGAFAKNFLLALEKICQIKKLDFHKRLEYYLTDYSEITLDEIKNSGRLKNFPQIIFKVFDVLQSVETVPEVEADMTGKITQQFKKSFHCIFSTYLLDQLPCRVISKHGDQLLEKYMRMEIPEKYRDNVLLLQKKLLQGNKWIKKIKKSFEFREINPTAEDEIPPEDLEILDSCFRKAKESTVIYSYGAKIALKNMFELLNPEYGLIISSDFNAASRGGIDIYEPCYYGNSLAQPVNFEFLYRSFTKNQKVILFEDPIKPLHTLIICSDDFKHPLRLGMTYEKVFKQNLLLKAIYKFLLEIKQSIYILILIMVVYLVRYILEVQP